MADVQVALPAPTPALDTHAALLEPQAPIADAGDVQEQPNDVEEPAPIARTTAPAVEVVEEGIVDTTSNEMEPLSSPAVDPIVGQDAAETIDIALFPPHELGNADPGKRRLNMGGGYDSFDLCSAEDAANPFPFSEFTSPELTTPEFATPDLTDVEVDLSEAFPFTEEDEIDPGPIFQGVYIVYAPETVESQFPFYDMAEEELREVISGNFMDFFESPCGHEFYRNYLRGQTLRQLRMALDRVEAKPRILPGLFNLPSELLYDVLELAHPLDLLHLSRATKQLRTILLNKRAEIVWRHSYEKHQELPHYPEEICPPKWTAMLFSDARCDFCGERGALLDFAYDEHYCDSCQQKYIVEQQEMEDILSRHSRQLPIIWTLIIPTYRQCGRKYQTFYETESNARFRRKDVEAMIETLKDWYMTIDEGMIPEAGEKFDEWTEAKVEEVRKASEYAQRANGWAMSVYYSMVNEMSDRQRSLAEQCMKRFTKHGYDERDTTSAVSDVYYYLRNHEVWRMTPKIFEQHQRVLIEKICGHKLERVKRERRELVVKFYQDYKKTLKPEQWAYLPPSFIVTIDDIFDTYINRSLDDATELPLTEATARLPKLIDWWLFTRRKELYEMIPGVSPVDLDSTPFEDEEVEKRAEERRATEKKDMEEDMDRRMKLATCVFSCTTCKTGRHAGMALIGWDAACVHMCGSMSFFYHSGWEFCTVGYAAAASIIRQLGLDPATTTPAEVDALDVRFFCGNCPVKTHRRVQGRKAYTWRECVTHAVEKEEDHTHAVGAWLLLSPEAIQFVKGHEAPYPLPRKAIWGCNHCPEHLETAVTLKEAKEHVKTSHSVAEPAQGVDYIDFKNRYERGRHYRRRYVFHYSIEPTCNLKCKLCPVGRVERMWTIQALVPHLFHMHGISTPCSGRDYSKIEVLAT